MGNGPPRTGTGVPLYPEDEGGRTATQGGPNRGEGGAAGSALDFTTETATEATPMSGQWAKGLFTRAAIVNQYYTDERGPIPLGQRLQQFRNQYAQSGDADLDQWVLDYQLALGPPKWEAREGIGSKEADVEKRRPKAGTIRKMTVAQLLEYLRTAPPDQVAKYQKLLRDSGYLNPDVYKQPSLLQNGVYDSYTQDAWTRLLKDAVMAGDTDVMRTIKRRQDYIDDNGGIDLFMKGLEPEREPFQAEVTASEDIEQVGEATAQELTGRKQEGFAEGLVGGFQAEEVSAQREYYDEGPTGGTTERNPSLDAYAEAQLRKKAPTEVGSYAGLGAFNVIMSDLGLAG